MIRHIDHIRPYRVGGPTDLINGRGECERGNHVREMPGWRVDPGDLVSLVIRRGETTLTVPARLSYPSGRFLDSQDMMDHMGGELSFRRSGFNEVIPHDTVIAPNACGGPLVDLSGKAIGINIARAGRVQTLALPRASSSRSSND